MEVPPSYPPPPDQPPTGFEPVPAIDSPAQLQGQYRVSRNLWLVISAVFVLVTLLVGAIGYIFSGYADTSSRISQAAGAGSAANLHPSPVNTTLAPLYQQKAALQKLMGNKPA